MTAEAGGPAQAHRGLRMVALLELLKSTFALLAASGLELLGPAPIRRWVHGLVEVFHLDARHSVLATFGRHIDAASVHMAAGVAATYGVIHLVEAWGLWRARRWASWLGCLAAALYLPIEFYALIRNPGWPPVAVVLMNLAIVWVLARDLAQRRWAPTP